MPQPQYHSLFHAYVFISRLIIIIFITNIIMPFIIIIIIIIIIIHHHYHYHYHPYILYLSCIYIIAIVILQIIFAYK